MRSGLEEAWESMFRLAGCGDTELLSSTTASGMWNNSGSCSAAGGLL